MAGESGADKENPRSLEAGALRHRRRKRSRSPSVTQTGAAGSSFFVPDTSIDKRLSGRRILVTAGPTWVPIDAVRHISNASSGRTGIALSAGFAEEGAEVVLLLGPGSANQGEKAGA